MSGVIDRFPLLLPVRNPVAGYGASAVARTSDRGHVAEVKNQFHGVAGSQSGFPKKPFSPLMSTCAVSSKHKDAEHRPQRDSGGRTWPHIPTSAAAADYCSYALLYVTV
jgi:hypothetical protein